ncbi:MAG TPA: hypothetical protein VIU61_12025 [Kofleriaceae bacterium]
MNKIAIASLLALVALTGCPKKKDEPAKTDPAPKVVEPPKADETPKPDPTLKPDEAPKPAAFPAECTDYKEAVTKAEACEKLATKADVKKKFDESWAAWEKLDDAGRTAAAAECKTAATSVKDATKKACP